MPGTFLMTPMRHRRAAARLRREAMTHLDRAKAPGLLQLAGTREIVADMIEKRVREGTHKLPDRTTDHG